ncbi:hypothetical protein B0O80DRAFT_499894 [Mortierella sp. GBAus27b]|nr:hypothetical protein B0O80DRAFT_499894 [Mortierella sp. GBAus27b]
MAGTGASPQQPLGLSLGPSLVSGLPSQFCVPSPQFESTLPVYTHSPIPTPAVFHTPARSDAVPAAPAIRLHPAAEGSTSSVTKGARFADPEDEQTGGEGLTPPAPAARGHNVKFQTRPRANTADSTNSLVYPTFAAYRQAQHGNIEAFTQRVKRAFALSQQQQRQQHDDELKQQQLEQEQQQKQGHESQELQVRPPNSRTQSSSSIQSALSPPPGTRSRSASAASMLSDFAERIKSGSFFKRSPSSNLVPTLGTVSSYDASGMGNGPEDTKISIPTEQGTPVMDRVERPSGIEVFVTTSEDDLPRADGVVDAGAANHASSDAQHSAATTPSSPSSPSSPVSRPEFSRSNTRESSPLVTHFSD